MATARHRRWWASTARLWPRRSGSAARGTEREQISLVDVADASFRTQLSMDETTPAPPSTGMGSSARSCGRPRLPSSGDRGRSDCRSCRSRGNACCVLYPTVGPRRVHYHDLLQRADCTPSRGPARHGAAAAAQRAAQGGSSPAADSESTMHILMMLAACLRLGEVSAAPVSPPDHEAANGLSIRISPHEAHRTAVAD